jgi:hypothetical protein
MNHKLILTLLRWDNIERQIEQHYPLSSVTHTLRKTYNCTIVFPHPWSTSWDAIITFKSEEDKTLFCLKYL